MRFEKVITVSDWYDGPRQGVANFQGRPHFYDCVFCGANYTNRFHLTPIPVSFLELILEEDQIVERWMEARRSGANVSDDKPCLQDDEARYLQLRSLLEAILQTDRIQSVIREGHFRVVEGADEVRWVDLHEQF